MAPTDLQKLFDQLSDLLGLPRQPLASAGHGAWGFTLHIDGVDIQVARAPAGQAPAVFVIAPLGAPQTGQELPALRTLLDANHLLLEAGAASFARNPLSGELLVQRVIRSDDATAPCLHRTALQLARLAQDWRADRLLAPAEPALPATAWA